MKLRRCFGDEVDDATILRFLIAFVDDEKVAKDRLEQAIAWRKENKFDELMQKVLDLDESEIPYYDIFKRFSYENDFYTEDKHGNPVSFVQVQRLDPAAFTGNISLEMFSEIGQYIIARNIARFTKFTNERNTLVRGVRIIDLQGLGLKHISPEMVKYIKTVVSPAQKNVPEHLFKCYIINAPTVFTAGWAVFKSFLEQRTQNKIKIMGTNYLDALLEHVSIENLPKQYGGLNEKPIFGDAENDFKKELVGAGKMLSITEKVVKDSTLSWDFRTLSKNIAFGVELREDSGHVVDIVPKKKFDSHTKIETGSYTFTTSGEATVVFDNTFSMFSGKDLVFKVQFDHPQ